MRSIGRDTGPWALIYEASGTPRRQEGISCRVGRHRIGAMLDTGPVHGRTSWALSAAYAPGKGIVVGWMPVDPERRISAMLNRTLARIGAWFARRFRG